MSQTSPTPNQRVVTELKVSAHQMLLEPGLYCVFHAAGAPVADAATGLPGVRITRSPATPAEALSISTFSPDGWLGADNGAALVRVSHGQAQLLVTIYQATNSTQDAPKLQVLRLSEAPARPAAPVPVPATDHVQAPDPAPAVPPAAPRDAEKPEIQAHVQRRGDVLTRLGDWMGVRGSQNWIEGFAVAPQRLVQPADIEYQAVLGKGWLSPWAEGGSYCGSRGMALPILGLRVRLKGEAAGRHQIRVSATFTDGSVAGPVDGTETAEAPSLAPLEAFLIEILPRDGAGDADASAPNEAVAEAAARPAARTRPKAAPRAPAPAPVASRARTGKKR